ncbi:hypothetical protein OIU79_014092 [Salix purpurea]|uniref:Uncharacterized protein n=1 Tax=Salix purpurea TaxID=77065 RepID=A0A9Q0PQ27_SALPP|nr:hypothetical protein OIU79_014092 [Salix purpurea]
MQSCLSQKYEALLLRDAKSTGEQSLQISYLEWLNIDRDWLDTITDELYEDAQIIEEIKRFKDRAVKSAASGSDRRVGIGVCAKNYANTRAKRVGYFNRSCMEESILGLLNSVFETHKLQRNEIKLVEIVDVMEW